MKPITMQVNHLAPELLVESRRAYCQHENYEMYQFSTDELCDIVRSLCLHGGHYLPEFRQGLSERLRGLEL